MRLGLHTSRAGSLENAAVKCHQLGGNTFQIFSSSPRMWRASHLDPADIQRLRKARETWDLNPLVIHTNYLANLASIDPVIREKSIRSFRGELDRAKEIGADYLVLHPGNYKDQSVQQGIAAFVLGLGEAAHGFKADDLTILLENTVGSGRQLGSKFEELRMIRDLSERECPLPLGYCFDTCHLFAAGFDIADPAGLDQTIAHADQTLGISEVKVIHSNDSKGELGSHLDRHENIGKGKIGEDGFRRILTHPALRNKPFILETPMDDDELASADLQTLKRLSQPSE